MYLNVCTAQGLFGYEFWAAHSQSTLTFADKYKLSTNVQ